MIIKGYIFIYLYLAIILFITYILNRVFKVRGVITRKFVHIMVSFTWVFLYYFFGTSYHIMIPPITFVILNYISYKKNIFKGMETEDSFGTVYYPISVFIMSLVTFFMPDFYLAYGIGLFCMGLGDGFAPLVAGYLKSRKIINKKTLTGTMTVLLISLFVACFFNIYFKMDYNFFKLVIIGVSASLLELIGIRGLDNLYLPLGVSLITFLLGVI